jgi:hypothetical protein
VARNWEKNISFFTVMLLDLQMALCVIIFLPITTLYKNVPFFLLIYKIGMGDSSERFCVEQNQLYGYNDASFAS